MIGKTISHYKIIEKLGEGGMGVVYKAQDTTLDRFVAIKFLPPHLSKDEEATKRFIHEAKAASALDHANIGTIHEVDKTSDGRTFIVMAHYEGETLRQKIDMGKVTVEEAITITSQIAAGLAKAHDKDIVHRDIKPLNIIVTSDGEAKIIDFGLAKLAGRTKLTKTGSTLGTVAYMSPEQAKGEEVDHRSDIFSLGAVLYEMLTGEPPFRGEHEAAILYEIVHEEPVELARLKVELSPELFNIVEQSLEKDPKDRYQSAEEILADLKVTGSVVHRKKFPRFVFRKSRKRVGKIYVPVVIIAVLVIFITLAYFILKRKTREPTIQETPSVAVLYMENLNPEKENDYFVAGMTDDIITELTRIAGLRVMDRSAVERYRGRMVDAKEVGNELNVAYVLTGSVRLTGEKLRVAGRLIAVKDGFLVWGDTYDRTLEDVFEVQAEVARAIVRALRVALKPEEEERLRKKPTENIQAYDFYLRGMQYLDKRAKAENLLATEMFQRAIAIDSLFADAYIQLGKSYWQRIDWGFDRDVKWWNEAERMIVRALEIDLDNPLGYDGYGTLYRLKGEYKEAAKWIEKALALSPNNFEILRDAALIYYFDAQYEMAREYIECAISLNPTNPEPYRQLGRLYMVMGRPDEAERSLRKAVEIGPDLSHVHYYLGHFLLVRGRLKEARDELDIAIRLNPDSHYNKSRLGMVELLEGNAEAAVENFEYVREHTTQRTIYYLLGCAYEESGEIQRAREVFEQSVPELQREVESHPNYLDFHIDFANILLKLDRIEDGRRLLVNAETIAANVSHEKLPRNRLKFAHAYLALGDTSRALDYVADAVRDNYYSTDYIWADPCLEGLQSNPLFQQLLGIKK